LCVAPLLSFIVSASLFPNFLRRTAIKNPTTRRDKESRGLALNQATAMIIELKVSVNTATIIPEIPLTIPPIMGMERVIEVINPKVARSPRNIASKQPHEKPMLMWYFVIALI